MPEWIENPNWFVVLLTGAVVGAVIGEFRSRATPALLRWVRGGLRWANYGRKMVGLARKPSRVSSRGHALSRWRAAPAWVLSSTLFRWFAADPQTWWEYVKRVHESHTSEVVTQSAGRLLWADKTVADLQVGDIYHHGNHHHGNHVLALFPRGERIQVTNDYSFKGPGQLSLGSGVGGGAIKPVTDQVSVNRGWCPRGDDCAYCSMNDQDFRTFTKDLQAQGPVAGVR